MLRNYLVSALRNLVNQRLYSAINIGGLALGLAACLLILLFVRDELSYDDWLPNADRIANVEITYRVPNRAAISIGSAPGPVKAAIEADFASDVERVVRILRSEEPLRVGDRQFADRVSYVDPGFFQVFDLPMASGEREAALANNTNLLLSERMARKYFGDEPPIGKVLTVNSKIDYTVVGVFKDLPMRSHLDLQFIALLDPQRYASRTFVLDSWLSSNPYAYVLFRSPEAMDRVRAGLTAMVDRHATVPIPGLTTTRPSDLIQLDFRPVPDIHFHATADGYMKPNGDLAAVYAFSAVALMILVIACINFVNLATARSLKRAREVALRKVVGATRRQLVGQYLGEAVLTAAISLLLAVALAELLIGPYSAFLHKELSLDFGDPVVIAAALGLIAVVGLLGGLYPALHLSRVRPARVLKANQSASSGSPRLRNALVVFQFAISIGLIISTVTVYAQTVYARHIDVGFESQNKLTVTALEDMPSPELRDTLRKEVAALPGVIGAGLSSDGPPLQGQDNALLSFSTDPTADRFLFEKLDVDFDFLQTYKVKPLAGRLFSREFPSDVQNLPEDPAVEATESIVVNQSVLRKLGIARPEDAIGKTMWDALVSGNRMGRATIIGVIPDMHLRSVRVEINPFVYIASKPDRLDQLSIDVEPGRMSEVRAGVEQIWRRLAPGIALRTGFVDENLAALYDADEQRAQTFAAFAGFAIVIACLGLFGLASFAAEKRTKEIGLRKVLGASVLDIVRLLVWQFSKPVLVANVIAWPVAFYFMHRWLTGFRYAIDLTSPLLFAAAFGGAGLMALAIAWSTVAGHATKVARSSPIHALRCE